MSKIQKIHYAGKENSSTQSWGNQSFQGITTSKCYTFDKTSLVLFIFFLKKENTLHWLFPAPKPRSTDSVGKGTGRRVNCGWGYPHVGDGRIPGYWALSRVGTGMALTTAAKQGYSLFFNPMYPHIKQKGSGYIFTSSNPHMLFTVSRSFLQLPLSQSPFRILEKTAHSSIILLRSITLRFTYFCGFRQRHD